jgi:dipeptidyl aminopeptidase/acylaminoacyl peptidase
MSRGKPSQILLCSALLAALLALGGCAGASPLPAFLGGATATPRPTLTPTLTPTPLPSATPTATLTPTPTPHPLSIAALRATSIQAGEVTIERELEARAGYRRFIASYPSEGLRIQALLTIPTGEAPSTGWPLVVFNHGYIAPNVYRTATRYVAYVDAFARNGYVVFMSDYRGHGDSEGEAPGGYGSQAYTVDVLHGLAAARRLPEVNPEQVGMWGHSMGGWISLRSMVVTDTIAAGVLWGGVVVSYEDLLSRWRRPTNFTRSIPRSVTRWRDQLIEQFGDPAVDDTLWRPLSANHYLADLSGPLELHHGAADASVPLSFAETLQEEMFALGRETELFAYPGDDHNISANLSTALARSVAFFDRHVKGEAP